MVKRKRGALLDSEYTILNVLAVTPTYSYALAEALDKSQTTMNDALRRLAAMGYVAGRWDTKADRVRRVYRLTPKGRQALAQAQAG